MYNFQNPERSSAEFTVVSSVVIVDSEVLRLILEILEPEKCSYIFRYDNTTFRNLFRVWLTLACS